MDANDTVGQIFTLLYAYGGFVLFPLVAIEGPVVTVIAGFLASIGVFRPIPTFLIIIGADLTADILYYSLGRWWLESIFTKLTNLFKIKPQTIDKLEAELKRNKGKVLFFGKLSHVFGLPILIAAGHAKITLPDFIWYNLLAAVPKSLVFFLVGYLLGNTINNYNRYVNITILGIFVLTLLIVTVRYLSRRIVKRYLTHHH
ncbi:hypothetical protein A2421_01740 [Candidatus Woesebacteria bacterium RIFOXYC1_FULL_43_18]|nr:MAG: hypothetical protein A2421_01740 [Candidatus Woesebacteria bacterium RIFOXYC1_FULL_43_18]